MQFKKERLISGDTSLTPSSDEAIAADLKSLVDQIEGTGIEIIEGETFIPRMLPDQAPNVLQPIEERPSIQDRVLKLKPTDSGYALKIWKKANKAA